MEEQTTPKKGMNPLLIVVVVLLLLAGGWLVLSKSKTPTQEVQVTPTKPVDTMSNEEMKQSPTATAMEETTVSPTVDENGVKNVTIEGKNFSFTPSQVTVKKGDKVKITFKNVGGFHNLTVDYNGKIIATKSIQTDQTDSIEFIADKAGTYAYYCSVGNHRQMGMEGKLIVQ